MRKTCLFLVILAIGAISHESVAAVGTACMILSYDTDGKCTSCATVSRLISCGSSEIYCDCATCDGLRVLKEETITTSSSENFTINKCVLDAIPIKPCKNCVSSDWGALSTGYESKVAATCNTTTGVCTKTTEYRCATGYYGSSTNGTSGCNECPSSGTTASAGATSISECCLASGTTGGDNTGTYTYTGDCCYGE